MDLTGLLASAEADYLGFRFAAAHEKITAALAAAPGDPRAIFYAAQLAVARGDAEGTRRHFETLGLAPGPDHDEYAWEPYRSWRRTFLAEQRDAISAARPAMVIASLPKSASSYVTAVTCKLLQMPVCRTAAGHFPQFRVIDAWARQAALGGAVTHEHLAPVAGNLDALRAAGIRRIAVHVRDPRQALISFLYTDIARAALPPRPPLGRALPWSTEEYYRAEVEWLAQWAEAEARPPAGLDVQMRSFEQLVGGYAGYFHDLWSLFGVDLPAATIARALEEMQEPGTRPVRNFRKGATDEWRAVVSPPEREKMWDLMPGDLAARFGWEA